jgi:glycosyltransferase involved in cell wall biosynthesis
MSYSPHIQSFFYNNPDYYPPIINSAILLHKVGYVQTIICRDNLSYKGQPYPETTTLHRILSNTRNSLLEYIGFIVQTLRYSRAKSEIYIGHDMHGFLVARIVSMLKRRPVIYHCHDFAESESKLGLGGSLVRTFERLFAKTADIVIVPDYDRATVVAQQLNLPKFPIIAANAPIHTPPKSNTLRETLHSRGYHFEKIVLRQGRISQGHALEVTLQSMPNWASKEWGFVLLGFGDDAYIESLYQLATKLGVREQFVILPAVNYDSVLQYTVGANMGHALYEPLHINNRYITTASNKIMEYMAAGLPILLSATTSSDNLLARHPVGITADVTSPETIADAINTVLSNPSLANSMSIASRHAFESEFQYEKQYAPVLEAIAQLIYKRKLAHAEA